MITFNYFVFIFDDFIMICQCSMYKWGFRDTFFREMFRKINIINIKAINE